MKSLLTVLISLTIGTNMDNLSDNFQKTVSEKKITTNYIKIKIQSNTIYIDRNGKKIITNAKNLSNIDSQEVLQIGFYKNENNEIQAVRMPKTIKKVPNQLPSEITSLKDMFVGSVSFNQDLSNWNTVNITNMDFMFNGASSFNGNIVNWNISYVKSSYVMFAYATSFNQDISKWNVSNINRFSLMFYGASSFNKNISKWNTASAVYMNSMFYGASSFNQDISKWNVEKVTEHSNFANYSGITNPNKLPKFKNNV